MIEIIELIEMFIGRNKHYDNMTGRQYRCLAVILLSILVTEAISLLTFCIRGKCQPL